MPAWSERAGALPIKDVIGQYNWSRRAPSPISSLSEEAWRLRLAKKQGSLSQPGKM